MWIFLSNRIRTWLLLGVALPVTGSVVHRLAARAQRRSPEGRSAKVLAQADSAVTSVSRRRGRRRNK